MFEICDLPQATVTGKMTPFSLIIITSKGKRSSGNLNKRLHFITILNIHPSSVVKVIHDIEMF